MGITIGATLVIAGFTGFVALRLVDQGNGLYTSNSRLGALHKQLQHQLHMPYSNGKAAGGVLGIPATGPGSCLGSTSNGIAGPVPTGPSVDTTKIVKRGNLSIQVPEGSIDRSLQLATDIAARYGGFVQSTSTYGADAGEITLRVPVTRFERAGRRPQRDRPCHRA
jgi:hypothetical protein